MAYKRKSYRLVHSWLQRHYGKANKCESVNCNGLSRTFQWAKRKKKKYQRKRENFFQLCVSCHMKYDYTEDKRRKMIKITTARWEKIRKQIKGSSGKFDLLESFRAGKLTEKK